MLEDDGDDDESDKYLEARDRRYSCLKLAFLNIVQFYSFENQIL